MGKFLKALLIFVLVLLIGISSVAVASAVSPNFREKIENFLKINDENSISNLKNKIETLESEKAELESQINGYEDRINALREEIDQLNFDIEELKAQDKVLNEEITKLQSRVNVLESEVNSLEGTIIDLNLQIDELNKEVDSLWNIFNNIADYDEAVSSGGDIPEMEMTTAEKEILENKIDELEQTVSVLTEEVEELNKTIQDLNNQIDSLTEEKTQIETEKTKNETIIVEKTQNIENVTYEINNYYDRIEVIENAVSQNNSRIEELNKKQEESTITEEEKQELENLELENANFESEKYDIEKNLSELEETVSTMREEVSLLQKNNEEYTRQIENIDKQVADLENQVSELETNSKNVQSNINSIRDKINKFNGLIENSIIVTDPNEPATEPEEPIEHTHTASEAVIENEVIENGLVVEYDKVVYCSVCGEEISREHIKVETTEEPTEPESPDETEDPTEEVLSFTIMSQPFYFENGMTFEQFVNSDYNIVGEGEYKQIPFSINENGEVVMSQQVSETETITFRVYGVSASDTILNQNYWFEFSNVPDFGLVDGKSYGDWISSENNALKVQTYDISYVNLFPEFEEYKNELVLYKNDIGFVLGFYCNATHRFVNIADKIGQSNLDLIVVGTNHYHIAGEPVIENEKFDTEANRISYELVYYCTQCGKEVSREFVGIDSPIDPELCEHTETYLQMTGAYYDENQNLISCNVVYYCNICGTRVSVEHLDFSEKDSASCVHSNLYTETLDENREDGLYKITRVYCLDCGKLVKSDSVLVCDHSAGTHEEEVVVDSEDGAQTTFINTICVNCRTVVSSIEKTSDTTTEGDVTSEEIIVPEV